MSQKIADYIREARAAYGLSQRAVADMLGGYSVAPIEAGLYLPSAKAAKRLAKALQLPPEFLAALADERARQGGQRKSPRRVGHRLRNVGDVSAEGADFALDDTGHPLESKPLLAGVTPFWEDERAFAFRMGDDSMAPLFREGDLLIVSGAKPYVPGDAVLATTVEGRSYCRLVGFDDDDVLLSAVKAAIAPLRVPRDQVAVILKVVAHYLR